MDDNDDCIISLKIEGQSTESGCCSCVVRARWMTRSPHSEESSRFSSSFPSKHRKLSKVTLATISTATMVILPVAAMPLPLPTATQQRPMIARCRRLDVLCPLGERDVTPMRWRTSGSGSKPTPSWPSPPTVVSSSGSPAVLIQLQRQSCGHERFLHCFLVRFDVVGRPSFLVIRDFHRRRVPVFDTRQNTTLSIRPRAKLSLFSLSISL